jgi:serine O-acetyltransferase
MKRSAYMTPYSYPGFKLLNYLMIYNKPFRSVFYMRLRNVRVFPRLNHIFYRPLDSIEFGDNIGSGLLVFHNTGCVVYPERAGKNLTVGHLVTIGEGPADETGRTDPIIGDNVRIFTGSIVFGPITVGNNVTIGAGTVLNKSVPDNCIVVGNPARIIKKDGEKCNIPM